VHHGGVATLDQINRTVTCEILPDFRKRVTRRYDIVDGQATMKDGAKFDANVREAWGTEDDEYTGCRLVKQDVTGQVGNPNKTPNDPPAYLVRVFEEIPENDRVIVGLVGISYDQYGRKTVVLEYIQLSAGSTVYTDTVGTSTAPVPNAECVLKNVEGANDGTIRSYKLTYIDSGLLASDYTLNFGGNLIILTLTSLNEIPATPAGYTLFGPGVEYIEGLPVYKYRYAAVNGGGIPGAAAEIGRSYYNAQGGTVDFNPASPTSADGTVKQVIEYITAQTVTANPIPTPSGFVFVGIDSQQAEGYKRWTGTYYRADGLVVDESNIVQAGALVTYHRVSYGTAPTTPSATIGGTVTLFEESETQQDGYTRFERRWVEGDGQSSITTRGQSDGSLDYNVVTFTAAASTPAYPGSGTAYLVSLSQEPDNGYFKNSATYTKLPATVTLKQTTQFEKPGNAVFTGSPPQLVITAPVTMTILADMEVSYAETQLTDAPFTVEAPATFYEAYTPTDTGIAVTSTQALGRYLAGASGISGTNSNYNGILCDAWAATLGSSTPSSFSLDLKVLRTENEIYLTATDGTVVFRRTKISYDFS
jgi:hypothetical protein